MSKIKVAIALLLAAGASFFIAPNSVSQTRTETNNSAAVTRKSPIVVEKAQIKCSVEAYRVGYADEIPDKTNVRAKPDKNAALLKSIAVKDEIIFYITGSDNNGWFEISRIETTSGDVDETLFEGRGWVNSSMIDLSVAAADPRLYAAPRKKSRVLKKLIPDASPARPVACRGDWMKVKSGKTTGWLSRGGQCANPLTTCP